MTDRPWHRALAYALTGQDLPLSEGADPATDALAAELEAAGWNRPRLRDHVQAARAAGHRWPHPLPADLAERVPAAQFAAVLAEITEAWRLVPTVRRVRHREPPGPEDRRLLRDLPPHFGRL